jgi:branched-chain amino acid transport system permease protein
MVIALVLLSELTQAWVLYLGLVFLFMVVYAPGGIASLIMMNLRLAAFGKLRQLSAAYLALAGTALAVLVGAGAMIEMVYHLQLNGANGGAMKFMGATLDAQAADTWFGAGLLLATGVALFELTRREFVRQWGAVQAEIEKAIQRRDLS